MNTNCTASRACDSDSLIIDHPSFRMTLSSFDLTLFSVLLLSIKNGCSLQSIGLSIMHKRDIIVLGIDSMWFSLSFISSLTGSLVFSYFDNILIACAWCLAWFICRFSLHCISQNFNALSRSALVFIISKTFNININNPSVEKRSKAHTYFKLVIHKLQVSSIIYLSKSN